MVTQIALLRGLCRNMNLSVSAELRSIQTNVSTWLLPPIVFASGHRLREPSVATCFTGSNVFPIDMPSSAGPTRRHLPVPGRYLVDH